jgi:ferrous iron transport protein A
MDEKQVIDITKMKQGESATVVEIRGGRGLLQKLDSLGIMPGSKIVKLSAQIMRGPINIRVGNSRIAIGYGIARKIIVEK